MPDHTVDRVSLHLEAFTTIQNQVYDSQAQHRQPIEFPRPVLYIGLTTPLVPEPPLRGFTVKVFALSLPRLRGPKIRSRCLKSVASVAGRDGSCEA